MKHLLTEVWQAVRSGSWAPIACTAVTAAVSFGFLDATQASTLTNAVSAVATAVAALIAAMHTVRGVKLVRAGES
ncbi:MAG: hypothetical protein ACRDMV_10885 [Streptosporangiales bacterium]